MNIVSDGAGNAQVRPLADGDDECLTTAEVALRLKMSQEWVRDHAAELGAFRAGGSRGALRFEPSKIEDYKERQRLVPLEIRVSRKRAPRAPSDLELLPLP